MKNTETMTVKPEDVTVAEFVSPTTVQKLRTVKLSDLTPRPDLNPRIGIDEKHATRIADEVRLTGTIDPLRVWEVKNAEGKWEYHISRGAHRHRAFQILEKSGDPGKFDLSRIPVEVMGRVETPQDEVRFRADFFDHNSKGLSSDLEWTRVCVALRNAGRSIRQIAALTRKSTSFVKQRLDTFDMPREVFAAFELSEKMKNEGKDPELNPEMPVFNQPLWQALFKAHNAKIGNGRTTEGEAPVDPGEFDKLWGEWKADKGRSLVARLSEAPILKKKEIEKLRADIADGAEPAAREPMLAAIDMVLRRIGADLAYKRFVKPKGM